MNTHRSSRSRRPRGFTLIELLTTLAIVGLLYAILMPVFSSARDRARRTVCISNLHQIGLAVAAYRGDWGNVPPVLGALSPAQVTSPAILACAADPHLAYEGYGGAWWRDAHRFSAGIKPLSYCYWPPATERWWNYFAQHPNMGYVVDVLHGEPNTTHRIPPGQVGPPPPYNGRYLRLRTDASVFTVAFRWPEVDSWDTCRIFTDWPCDEWPDEMKKRR